MDPVRDDEATFGRYRELQDYVGWSEADARRVNVAAGLLASHLPSLLDDFYAEIERHPEARKVITGGSAQIERLKGTLLNWVRELLTGPYDSAYVGRRWRAGWRHVEIGLDQVYTNVALSRLRSGLVHALHENWPGEAGELRATVRSLNTLLDLDLALIEDAYQAEYAARLVQSERLLARERSEAAFRTLVEAAPCTIVILRPDHTIVYFSRFAEELTGHAAAAVLGGDYFAMFLPGECHQAVADDLRRVLAGAPTRGFEAPVLCRDGSRRWVLWNCECLPDYEGGPAALAVGQDITTLKLAQERTLQAERLAAIGQMVTGLAHESGNALARSQACLEMLALEVEGSPEALRLVSRIQTAQDHLRQLYDEVRGYAAPLKLDREECDLGAVWRQAWHNLEMLRRGREAGLHEQTDGVNLRCAVDPFRLQQVFRNILENSLAACRDPVAVTITGGEATLEPGRPAVRVRVRDNGPGLTPEQRQRIFEPFFTTKTKGTGLGMAIARRIVEAHGGQIEVGPESEVRGQRSEVRSQKTVGESSSLTSDLCFLTSDSGGAEIVITLPRESS